MCLNLLDEPAGHTTPPELRHYTQQHHLQRKRITNAAAAAGTSSLYRLYFTAGCSTAGGCGCILLFCC
jgi:hypothetical protein